MIASYPLAVARSTSDERSLLGRLPNTAGHALIFERLSLSNLLSLLSMVLLEAKIVCHSMTPVVLTPFLEALLLCIIPLRWENVYSVCPAPMSELIDAPTPFIICMSTEDAIHLEVPSDVYIEISMLIVA